MMKYLILAAAAASVLATPSRADDAIIPPTRLGVYGGLGINMNDPGMKVWALPAGITPTQPFRAFVDDSTTFGNGGTGIGLNIGIMGGIALTPTIHLSGRIGYNGLNGSASATQRIADTSLTHDHDASLAMLEATPVVEFYDLIPGVSLHPLVGLELGLPISGTYVQTGETSYPNGFSSQTFARDNDIPNTTVRAALLLGVGYTMKLGSSTYLQPELSYRLPLTNVSSDVQSSPWKIAQLRLGVNLFWGMTPEAERPRRADGGMTASMDRIVSYDDAGVEQPVRVINVEDVAYTEMFPLVPYVFMPTAESTPDTAQQRMGIVPEKGDFVPEGLPLDAIEVNRNLLNIIGARMKKYPQATVTITGTHDGKAEAKSKDLAKARAEWAKSYLVQAFGIEPDRIGTVAGTMPAKASSSTDPDGIVENRRVEFSSNVPDVLMPLVITADNQRVADPDLIAFHPSVVSDDSVATWSMRISQAGRPLRDMSGIGTPGPLSWAIRPNELSNAQVPVDWEFEAMDLDGDTAVISGSLPVEYVSSVRKRTESLPDKTIDKYSLILFDFDKSTMTTDNERILERMVLPSIRANSRVSIIGYTDRIGNDDHNRKLSMERANTVKTFLQSRAKDASYTTQGVGESREIYPNDQPIGRQLSRTVQVVVETPRR